MQRDIQLLINAASNVIQNAQLYLNQALKDKNLSSAEANVLMFLYSSGDRVIQDAIVSATDVSKPAISRTINSLEKKGYITREPAEDKRAKLVCLTKQAREAEEFIQGVFTDFVKIASAGVPQEKVQDFCEIFQRVSENIQVYYRNQEGS